LQDAVREFLRQKFPEDSQKQGDLLDGYVEGKFTVEQLLRIS
jgi:hypothetical protein